MSFDSIIFFGTQINTDKHGLKKNIFRLRQKGKGPWNFITRNTHQIFGFQFKGSAIAQVPIRRWRISFKLSVWIRANPCPNKLKWIWLISALTPTFMEMILKWYHKCLKDKLIVTFQQCRSDNIHIRVDVTPTPVKLQIS